MGFYPLSHLCPIAEESAPFCKTFNVANGSGITQKRGLLNNPGPQAFLGDVLNSHSGLLCSLGLRAPPHNREYYPERSMKKNSNVKSELTLPELTLAGGKLRLTAQDIVADYRMAFQSRTASLIGRKEVLTGKAKFGIFGDGKELPQIALAKAFKQGDFRSGYYRDQTFMFATGMSNISEFFSQLYANTDKNLEPSTAGRGMNGHYGSRLLDDEGNWKSQIDSKNSSSDISPTGGQMARLLGLAYASKMYRKEPALKNEGGQFSKNGNEVAFGTIGDASTSEGIFFESMNAAGVLQVPLAMNVWDDGYGISVPREFQTTKGSISEALKGFARDKSHPKGFDIHVVKGWDYAALCEAYFTGIEKVRTEHVPALFHIVELTQPQGHSTSGSQERYKSKERLAWEEQNCCLKIFRAWILSKGFATAQQLETYETEDRKTVEKLRAEAWDAYMNPIRTERTVVLGVLDSVKKSTNIPAQVQERIAKLRDEVSVAVTLNRKLLHSALRRATTMLRGIHSAEIAALRDFLKSYSDTANARYRSHLHSVSKNSPLHVPEIKATFSESSESVDGRVVLQKLFDHHFATNPKVFALGEDVGKLGDVNLVFEGLNAKYGDLRVTDTGIREATIFGQGLGCALRGLRPLVDIQYLDYLLYALQVMSDDLACLHYRTAGGQKAPVIVRTKGHRLEGVWHTGSPIGMILHALRGIYVCVPRNMTQAAGLYNTLLQGDNPALVIEVLNAYRLKEKVPDNLTQFTVPLGVVEVLRSGKDVTLVTYGACVRVAQEAAVELEAMGIDVEIIDVQTLLPFDTSGSIAKSIQKTNAVLFLDEDVPGGASAYMLQQVLEGQKAYEFLDAPPRTLAAAENRSPYGTDGDYVCKPSCEDVVETIYAMMRERNQAQFPAV